MITLKAPALPRAQHVHARSLTPAPGPSRLIRDLHQYRPCNNPYARQQRHAQTPWTQAQAQRRAFSSSPSPKSKANLAGTVPAHSAYVLLHTHAPPSAYPPRSKSPLWRALTLHGRAWGAVANFAWAPEFASASEGETERELHPAYTGLGEDTGEREGEGDGGKEQEAYVASVFEAGRRGRVVVPEVTLAGAARLADVVQQAREGSGSGSGSGSVRDAERLFLYVCTHGARDCRCGEGGGEVVRALRAEVARRGRGREVFVGEVAHVGGHKYAANILVYPYGDWLGTVQELDVPQILDELLAFHAAHRAAPAETLLGLPPLCPPFWRGRMGLDKAQQLALISKY